MPKPEKELYYRDKGKRHDETLHTPILAEGDHAAAQKISDKVAREIGLTDAEIEALHAPVPPKKTGK
jgi:hypothetical protein